MNKIIRVGSRASMLAIKQSEIVMQNIKKYNPSLQLELVTIKTTGDKILNKTLDKIGGKGLFIKELEYSLLNHDIDIAVHSYKDMPYEMIDGLSIVALSKRDSPFDVLVLPKNKTEIDIKKPIGSSSLRRIIQFKELYPKFETKPIRGNIISRLEKLDKGEFSAIILAEAGLRRASLENRISKIFSDNEIIPSGSQGILAVQGRANEDYYYLSDFHNKESEIVSLGEREFLKTLNGGCSSPVAIFGQIKNNEIFFKGMYVDQFNIIEKGTIAGNVKKSKELGGKLATILKERAFCR